MSAKDSIYGYVPTRSVAIVFVALFAISTVVHIGQAVRYRMWWLFPTICIAGLLEVLGWSGRLWSSWDAANLTPFQIQICSTVLGPIPLVAANFIILGRVIEKLGSIYSRLPPRWYSIIFLTCDFVSLLIQGAGGGLASVASSSGGDPATGGNVMLGGIIFQLATITVYAILAAEFFVRYFKDKPITSRAGSASTSYSTLHRELSPRLKIMIIALCLSTIFLYVRAVYRTIELIDGWGGKVISTEIYFNVFDGAMVVLAIYTFNFAHPGFLLALTRKNDSEFALNSNIHTHAV